MSGNRGHLKNLCRPLDGAHSNKRRMTVGTIITRENRKRSMLLPQKRRNPQFHRDLHRLFQFVQCILLEYPMNCGDTNERWHSSVCEKWILLILVTRLFLLHSRILIHLDDATARGGSRSSFGYPTAVFRCLNQEDGNLYCLRRFDNVRSVSYKIATVVTDRWNQGATLKVRLVSCGTSWCCAILSLLCVQPCRIFPASIYSRCTNVE